MKSRQTIGEALEVLQEALEELRRVVITELRTDAAWLKQKVLKRGKTTE